MGVERRSTCGLRMCRRLLVVLLVPNAEQHLDLGKEVRWHQHQEELGEALLTEEVNLHLVRVFRPLVLLMVWSSNCLE